MSDYRSYPNPEDPFPDDPRLDPNVRPPNPAWGWIVGAIFVVIVFAVAFGLGHKPGEFGPNTASNDVTPPAVTHIAAPTQMAPTQMAPPANVAPQAATPAPAIQAPAPVTPALTPAQPNSAH
jgi:hypothetical protein